MNYAHNVVIGVFHFTENNIKVVVIVAREENPVRILIEELAVILQRILLHAEAGLYGVEYGINIHLCFPRIADSALIGCKP